MRFSYYRDGARPERAARPSVGSSFFSTSETLPAGLRLVPSDERSLYYVGRFPEAVGPAPSFAWQGSELLARFTGARLGFLFDAPTVGPAFFNVIVDGENRMLELAADGPLFYLLEPELGPGVHELVLYKRTEAFIGAVRLRGLLVEEGARLGPKPEGLPLRLEFYGDSITAGACNDDPGEDQYEDQSTHDNYLSYGSVAARELGAEYVSIAVSGTGLCESWNPVLMGEAWDKMGCDPAGRPGEAWDFSGRAPDIVVINLGQNDYGFPLSQGRPFPAEYARRYLGFARGLRAVYPRAAIVCAIGGMPAWHESAELRAAWEEAVAQLKAEDALVFDYRFMAFSVKHPRVELHRVLAAELAAYLRSVVLPSLELSQRG
jgi:hypothetical protein